MDFYPTFDSARDVASRPDTELYGLRGLLSVKYLFDNPSDDENPLMNTANTKMPGFKYLDTGNGVNIYENQYCMYLWALCTMTLFQVKNLRIFLQTTEIKHL